MEISNELKKAGLLDISENELADVLFGASDFMFKFSEETIIPLLKQVLTPQPIDNAIIGTYYRIQAWMSSLSSMNKTAHYQGVASATRSLFELLLDVLILKNDSTGKEVEKYFGFSEIEKYKISKKMVNFVDKNPSCTLDVSLQRKFINDIPRIHGIEQELKNKWGLNKFGVKHYPSHWSGSDLRRRAHQLGPKYEEIYIDTYPKLSWFIHYGLIGWDFSAPIFTQIFALCHDMAQKRFIEALVETSSHLKIDKGIEEFYTKIKRIEKVPAVLMFEKKMSGKKS